jgi:uncharacterized protein
MSGATMSMDRRKFLDRIFWGALGTGAALLGYTVLEAKWCRVVYETIRLPRLPKDFLGLKLAFLTDIHHGPFVPLDYVEHVVELTNEQNPDVICLGGDYVHRKPDYIAPCISALERLKSRMGTFAVLGNHDHWESAPITRAELKKAKIQDLTNQGVWLTQGDSRIRLGGVGDYWEEHQDLQNALADTKESEVAILLSHNPDYVEDISDGRVGLVIAGHTHGGQVDFPLIGTPLVPSSYGSKYVQGLVQTRATQIYISRGVGTITPPVRFRCRPEISLITLT